MKNNYEDEENLNSLNKSNLKMHIKSFKEKVDTALNPDNTGITHKQTADIIKSEKVTEVYNIKSKISQYCDQVIDHLNKVTDINLDDEKLGDIKNNINEIGRKYLPSVNNQDNGKNDYMPAHIGAKIDTLNNYLPEMITELNQSIFGQKSNKHNIHESLVKQIQEHQALPKVDQKTQLTQQYIQGKLIESFDSIKNKESREMLLPFKKQIQELTPGKPLFKQELAEIQYGISVQENKVANEASKTRIQKFGKVASSAISYLANCLGKNAEKYKNQFKEALRDSKNHNTEKSKNQKIKKDIQKIKNLIPKEVINKLSKYKASADQSANMAVAKVNSKPKGRSI